MTYTLTERYFLEETMALTEDASSISIPGIINPAYADLKKQYATAETIMAALNGLIDKAIKQGIYSFKTDISQEDATLYQGDTPTQSGIVKTIWFISQKLFDYLRNETSCPVHPSELQTKLNTIASYTDWIKAYRDLLSVKLPLNADLSKIAEGAKEAFANIAIKEHALDATQKPPVAAELIQRFTELSKPGHQITSEEIKAYNSLRDRAEEEFKTGMESALKNQKGQSIANFIDTLLAWFNVNDKTEASKTLYLLLTQKLDFSKLSAEQMETVEKFCKDLPHANIKQQGTEYYIPASLNAADMMERCSNIAERLKELFDALKGAATAAQTVSITTDRNNAAYDIDVPETAHVDEEVAVTIKPEDGYFIKTVSVKAGREPVAVTPDATDHTKYTFKAPEQDVTIKVSASETGGFRIIAPDKSEKETSRVTLKGKANNGRYYKAHSDVTLGIHPEPGYRVKAGEMPKLTDDAGNPLTDTTLERTKKPNEFTFVMPEHDVKITSVEDCLEKITAEVKIEREPGAHGTLTASSTELQPDVPFTFTRTPDNGYTVKTKPIVAVEDAFGEEQALTLTNDQLQRDDKGNYKLTLPADSKAFDPDVTVRIKDGSYSADVYKIAENNDKDSNSQLKLGATVIKPDEPIQLDRAHTPDTVLV